MEHVQALAPTTMPTQPRAPQSLAWLGVVPFFSFAALFLLLPTAYLVVGAFQDNEGHLHARQHRRALGAWHRQCLHDQPRSQRRLGHPRGGLRLHAGLGGGAGRAAGLAPARAPHLLGRGIELRRPATRLRVHRHPGADRPRYHHPAERLRLQPLSHRLQHPELLGPDAHLSLFPDPPHGADPHAGARWPQARVARGRHDPRRVAPHLLALCRDADPVAEPARHDAVALRQLVRRHRHRLRPDRARR